MKPLGIVRSSALVAAAIGVAVLGFSTAGGQSPVDNDEHAAESYSNGLACPSSDLVSVSEWEVAAPRLAATHEAFGLGQYESDMVDHFAYKIEAPADPPDGVEYALAVCVRTASGMMDTGARLLIDPEEGTE